MKDDERQVEKTTLSSIYCIDTEAVYSAGCTSMVILLENFMRLRKLLGRKNARRE